MADSIKNHLGRFFNEWIHLLDHAANVTQAKIEQNLEKDVKLYNMLKLKS